MKYLHKNGWKFNWNNPLESGCDIYKLLIKKDSEIQGLISLKKMVKDFAMCIEIIESAPHNLGKKGKYKGVGGHLFAIACQKSFENGFCGYVYFESKTNLMNYYNEKFGAVWTGYKNRMVIETSKALELINIYTFGGDI